MKKILLILIMSIFLISLVHGSISHLGTSERDSCIELPQSCTTCTYNNISKVLYPNLTTIALGETAMERNGNEYNYTYCITSTVGEYIVNGHGDLDGTDTIWNYGFSITPTGKELDNSQSILIIGLILILIFIASTFMYFGNKIEYMPFKIFLISMGVLFLMLTIGVSINTIKEIMIVGVVFSGTFVNLYRLMLILVSAGGIGLMLYIIYMSVRQFYAHRGLIDDID